MVSGINGSSAMNNYSCLSRVRESGARPPSVDDLFSKIDTDGDGSVNKDELSAFQSEMEARFASSVMGSPFDGADGTATSTDDLFTKIDTDGDGSVSKDEFKASRSEMRPMGPPPPPPATSTDDLFGMVDSDGDGTISEDELSTFQSEMRAEMEGLLSAQSETKIDTEAASTTSASGVETSVSDFAAFIMEAIDRYLAFAQTEEGQTSASRTSVTA
jgi:Ca2+-binding EF-hand superfamily protein